VTVSDIEKYSMTRSIAQPLYDSWASCNNDDGEGSGAEIDDNMSVSKLDLIGPDVCLKLLQNRSHLPPAPCTIVSHDLLTIFLKFIWKSWCYSLHTFI